MLSDDPRTTPNPASLQYLVLGASGLVGGAFHHWLERNGRAVTGTYHARQKPGLVRFDFGSEAGLLGEGLAPDVIVMASALTHVDFCETHPEEAYRRNVEDVRLVVNYSRARGCQLVFFSTDYVFDGHAGPYDEDAVPHPISVYGRTKRLAEELVLTLPRSLVLRITNVFDIGYDDRNFVHRCVTHLREREWLVVPADQLATPAYATWIADQCMALYAMGAILREGSPRLLHAGCDDLVSRGELARRIAARLGADASLIEERATAQLGQVAARPLRGGLKNDAWKRLLGVGRLPLDDALEDCLPRMRRVYAGAHWPRS